MKYLLLAFLITFAVMPVARGRAADWKSLPPKSAAELVKDAAELEAAVQREPDNIELYIRLGFTYAKLEKADDAQRAFENAVRLNPKRPIAQYMLGLIYEKKGETQKAITAWQACLENAVEERLRETARKHLHYLKGS